MESSAKETIFRLYPEEFLKPQKKESFWKKKKINITLISILLSIVILLNMHYYNKFVDLEQNIYNDKANIEAQVQRRNNLITYFFAMLNEYKKYEKDIFVHLGDTRNLLLKRRALIESDSGGAPDKPVGKGVNDALAQLMAIAEQYPDLKATDISKKIMAELASTEGKIAEARMAYNSDVNKYTTIRDMFPGNIFAFFLRMRTDVRFFKAQDTAEKIPEINVD